MFDRRKDRKDIAGTAGPPAGTKPAEGGAQIPPMPSEAPPPGTQWSLQGSPEKGWWWIAAAAVGAIGSYLSAQQANKPRTGYTDQTTTQTPYREDLYGSDIEAILNMQRDLINRGPSYVGGANARPRYDFPMPNAAPPRMERSDEAMERARRDLAAFQAGGGQIDRGGGGDRSPSHETEEPQGALPDWVPANMKGGMASGTRGPRTFGGWTADELAEDPSRVRSLGERGGSKYLRYQERQGAGNGSEEMGSSLAYLRRMLGRA